MPFDSHSIIVIPKNSSNAVCTLSPGDHKQLFTGFALLTRSDIFSVVRNVLQKISSHRSLSNDHITVVVSACRLYLMVQLVCKSQSRCSCTLQLTITKLLCCKIFQSSQSKQWQMAIGPRLLTHEIPMPVPTLQDLLAEDDGMLAVSAAGPTAVHENTTAVGPGGHSRMCSKSGSGGSSPSNSKRAINGSLALTSQMSSICQMSQLL